MQSVVWKCFLPLLSRYTCIKLQMLPMLVILIICMNSQNPQIPRILWILRISYSNHMSIKYIIKILKIVYIYPVYRVLDRNWAYIESTSGKMKMESMCTESNQHTLHNLTDISCSHTSKCQNTKPKTGNKPSNMDFLHKLTQT